MSGGFQSHYRSTRAAFIDELAIDVVVHEHRYMKLTTAEKRHAVHRLITQPSMTPTRIGDLLHLSGHTVNRILEFPPPPILDVDEETGELVSIGM